MTRFSTRRKSDVRHRNGLSRATSQVWLRHVEATPGDPPRERCRDGCHPAHPAPESVPRTEGAPQPGASSEALRARRPAGPSRDSGAPRLRSPRSLRRTTLRHTSSHRPRARESGQRGCRARAGGEAVLVGSLKCTLRGCGVGGGEGGRAWPPRVRPGARRGSGPGWTGRCGPGRGGRRPCRPRRPAGGWRWCGAGRAG